MKENGPHQKHLLGVAAIVLNLQDDRPESSQSPEFLDAGPHQKHLLGVAAIVLNLQDDRPESSQKQPKNGHFWTLNRPYNELDGSKCNETCLW